MSMSFLEWLIVAAIVAILGLLVVGTYKEGREWERFKVAHNCKPVAHIKGDVFNTFGVDSRGQMTVGIGSTPDKTGWACDDGRTYYR